MNNKPDDWIELKGYNLKDSPTFLPILFFYIYIYFYFYLILKSGIDIF